MSAIPETELISAFKAGWALRGECEKSAPRIIQGSAKHIEIIFETTTDQEGLISLRRSTEGLQLWVGGECKWRSYTP
jgi:hypothetical protein